MNTTVDQLKELLGAERLARLANMPLVKERDGIEAHLQQACDGAAGPVHALIKALRTAGSRPTAADAAALEAEVKELRAAEQQSGSAAEPQSSSAADPKAETKRLPKKPAVPESAAS